MTDSPTPPLRSRVRTQPNRGSADLMRQVLIAFDECRRGQKEVHAALLGLQDQVARLRHALDDLRGVRRASRRDAP